MGEPFKNKSISRRDLLKLVGGALGIGFLNAHGIGAGKSIDLDKIAMNEGLSLTLNFLKSVEDIPDGVENVPDKNDRFQFADVTLQNAINIYEGWTSTKPYYIRPENYLNAKQGLKVAWSKNNLTDLISGLPDISKADDKLISNLEHGQLKPFSFSAENIKDPDSLLRLNPGSGILEAIIKQIGADNHKGTEVVGLYKELTDPIWKWISTEKPGGGMDIEVMIAAAMLLNGGDIGKSLWDATLLAKLRSRNNNQTLMFNHPDKPDELSLIKDENASFIRDISDCFAPRVSANWVLTNVADESLFAYPYKTIRDKNYKPFDRYAAAGNIYHGLNVMALCTTVSPDLNEIMVTGKHLLSKGKIGIKGDYGWEKMAVGWLVASRAGKITKILDSYQRSL